VTATLIAWIVTATFLAHATLTGPAAHDLLVRHGQARTVPWVAAIGWVCSGAAVGPLAVYGLLDRQTHLVWIAAAIALVQAVNAVAWWKALVRERDPAAQMLYAIRRAESLGLAHVERLPLTPAIAATIGRGDTRQTIQATGMRLTKLDADGKPTGDTVTVTGTAKLAMRFGGELDEALPPSLRRFTPQRGLVPYRPPGEDQSGRHAMTEETRLRAYRELVSGQVPLCQQRVAEQPCQRLHGHEGDCSPTRVQCDLPVYSGFPQPPERCADDLGHPGICTT
jgi:hypothetical protein